MHTGSGDGMRDWWTLKRYRTEDGRDLTTEWYDATGDEDIQAAFDTRMDLLTVTENWFSPKLARMLEREHEGLCEIILELQRENVRHDRKRKLERLQFRPVGIITKYPCVREKSVIPGEFVLLLSCTKSGGTYEHVRAFNEALTLRDQLVQGKGTLHDF